MSSNLFNIKVKNYHDTENNKFEVHKRSNEVCVGFLFGHFPTLDFNGVDNWYYVDISKINQIISIISSPAVDIIIFDDLNLMLEDRKNFDTIFSLIKSLNKKSFFVTKGKANLSYHLVKNKAKVIEI
jgi:hypothetical protein